MAANMSGGRCMGVASGLRAAHAPRCHREPVARHAGWRSRSALSDDARAVGVPDPGGSPRRAVRGRCLARQHVGWPLPGHPHVGEPRRDGAAAPERGLGGDHSTSPRRSAPRIRSWRRSGGRSEGGMSDAPPPAGDPGGAGSAAPGPAARRPVRGVREGPRRRRAGVLGARSVDIDRSDLGLGHYTAAPEAPLGTECASPAFLVDGRAGARVGAPTAGAVSTTSRAPQAPPGGLLLDLSRPRRRRRAGREPGELMDPAGVTARPTSSAHRRRPCR